MHCYSGIGRVPVWGWRIVHVGFVGFVGFVAFLLPLVSGSTYIGHVPSAFDSGLVVRESSLEEPGVSQVVWDAPKLGVFYITKRPSIFDLATYFNTTIHECGGDVIVGGDIPPMCRMFKTVGYGAHMLNRSYEFIVNFADGPARIRVADGLAGVPQFVSNGFSCVFAPDGKEHFLCTPPPSFAASYDVDGNATIYWSDTPRQSIQSGVFAFLGVLCLVVLLDYGKLLTAGTPRAMVEFERILITDVIIAVGATSAFEVNPLAGGIFHPSLQHTLNVQLLDGLGMLCAVSFGTSCSVVLLSESTIFSGVIPQEHVGLKTLSRMCYETLIIQSVVLLTPAALAVEYHATMNFFVGVATAVLCGRDCTVAARLNPRPAFTFFVGAVTLMNLSLSVVMALPMLNNSMAVPATYEVVLAFLFVFQAFVVGATAGVSMAAKMQ